MKKRGLEHPELRIWVIIDIVDTDLLPFFTAFRHESTQSVIFAQGWPFWLVNVSISAWYIILYNSQFPSMRMYRSIVSWFFGPGVIPFLISVPDYIEQIWNRFTIKRRVVVRPRTPRQKKRKSAKSTIFFSSWISDLLFRFQKSSDSTLS